jgi:cytochrome P450 family 110
MAANVSRIGAVEAVNCQFILVVFLQLGTRQNSASVDSDRTRSELDCHGDVSLEMKKNVVSDYIAWLFFPSRFLFPDAGCKQPSTKPLTPRRIRVPGWETLDLMTDSAELNSFNQLVGDAFLGGAGNEFLVPLFGNQSAFTLDGAQHRLARKLISQSINSATVRGVAEQVPRFLDQEFPELGLGNVVRVGTAVRRMTMRAISRSVLGITDDPMFEKLLERFESTTGFFANFVSYNKAFWRSNRRISVGAEVLRRKRNIDTLIFELIEACKDEQGYFANKHEKRDLLSHLVACQSEYGYSDEFIRDNLVSTIAAGYDTTGSAITWMLFWLGKDSRSRQTLGELHRTDSSAYASYKDAFVSESLRYCPPLEILPRRPASQRDIPIDNYGNEATLVCPCPHMIHHDSSIYNEPRKFRPERFLERKFAPTEYFPFGLGNRLCLGIVLAPEIMKATLDWFISREIYFRFTQTRFQPIRRNVSLWPSFRMKAKIMRIEP